MYAAYFIFVSCSRMSVWVYHVADHTVHLEPNCVIVFVYVRQNKFMHIPIGFSIYHNLLLRHPYIIGMCVCICLCVTSFFFWSWTVSEVVRDYILFPFKFHIHLHNHLISSFKSFTLTRKRESLVLFIDLNTIYSSNTTGPLFTLQNLWTCSIFMFLFTCSVMF